jgi:hypothetical protein
MHDFCGRVVHAFDGKGDGALHAIEVIVEAETLEHEEGCRDTTQAQFRRQVAQEKVLNLLDSQLGLLQVEGRSIALGLDELAHAFRSRYIILRGKGTLFLSNGKQKQKICCRIVISLDYFRKKLAVVNRKSYLCTRK